MKADDRKGINKKGKDPTYPGERNRQTENLHQQCSIHYYPDRHQLGKHSPAITLTLGKANNVLVNVSKLTSHSTF